jgi:hypothetical protein
MEANDTGRLKREVRATNEVSGNQCDCSCELDFLTLPWYSLGRELQHADTCNLVQGGLTFVRRSCHIATTQLEDYRYVTVLRKLASAHETLRAMTRHQLKDPSDSDEWGSHLFEMTSALTAYLGSDPEDQYEEVMDDYFRGALSAGNRLHADLDYSELIEEENGYAELKLSKQLHTCGVVREAAPCE